MWMHEDKAVEYISRSKWRLRDWRLAGEVQAIKRDGQWFFESASLVNAKKRMEHNYKMRRIVPGSGRGRFKPVDQMGLWDE